MNSTTYSTRTRRFGLAGLTALALAGLLIAGPYGCSKKEEPAKPKPAAESTQTQAEGTSAPSAAAVEQFNKGVQATLKGDYDDAIAFYQKTLELDPKSSEAYNNMGFAYYDKGELDKSIEMQRKALEINPNLPNAHYGLALALDKKGDAKGALESWKAFIKFAEPHSKWWIKAQERITELEGGGKAEPAK